MSNVQLFSLENHLDFLIGRGELMKAIAFFEKYKLELQESKRYDEFARIIDKFVRSTGAGSSKGV